MSTSKVGKHKCSSSYLEMDFTLPLCEKSVCLRRRFLVMLETCPVWCPTGFSSGAHSVYLLHKRHNECSASGCYYADDIMFYRIIRSATDYHALQMDINSLCRWTDRNLLTFNANKCKYMLISRKKQQTLPSSPITIKGASLECVSSYKYLGVWLTSTLSWSLQVTEVCKKARR